LSNNPGCTIPSTVYGRGPGMPLQATEGDAAPPRKGEYWLSSFIFPKGRAALLRVYPLAVAVDRRPRPLTVDRGGDAGPGGTSKQAGAIRGLQRGGFPVPENAACSRWHRPNRCRRETHSRIVSRCTIRSTVNGQRPRSTAPVNGQRPRPWPTAHPPPVQKSLPTTEKPVNFTHEYLIPHPPFSFVFHFLVAPPGTPRPGYPLQGFRTRPSDEILDKNPDG